MMASGESARLALHPEEKVETSAQIACHVAHRGHQPQTSDDAVA
jgi:hypothetical protein